MVVVDANLLVYFTVESEHSPVARRVREVDPDWHTASLWRFEFRNALAKYMRGGYMSLESAVDAFTAAENAISGSEHVAEVAEVLNLVANSRCSAYDCEYVALALRFRVPLVTADRRVLREFPEVAVSPAAFARDAG